MINKNPHDEIKKLMMEHYNLGAKNAIDALVKSFEPLSKPIRLTYGDDALKGFKIAVNCVKDVQKTIQAKKLNQKNVN